MELGRFTAHPSGNTHILPHSRTHRESNSQPAHALYTPPCRPLSSKEKFRVPHAKYFGCPLSTHRSAFPSRVLIIGSSANRSRPPHRSHWQSTSSIVAADASPADGFVDLLYCDPLVNGVSTGCHLLRGSSGVNFTLADSYTGFAGATGPYTANFLPGSNGSLIPATLSARAPISHSLDLYYQYGQGVKVGTNIPTPGSPSPAPGYFTFVTYSQAKPPNPAKTGFLIEDHTNAGIFTFDQSLNPISAIGLQGWSAPFLTRDLRQSGKTDIISLDQTIAAQVDTYFGNGDGTFTVGPALQLPGGIFSMLVQDINGDGYPDLIAEGLQGVLSVFLGGPNGPSYFPLTLAGASNIATGNGGKLVGIADLNGDGIPDLITATPLGFSVLLGQSNLSYKLLGIYDCGPGRSSFALADFNNDGHLDLAVDNPAGIEICFGNADGSFGQAQALTGTLAASPEPSQYAANFDLTATLAPSSPAPTGTITFAVDGATVGTGNLTNNKATYTVTNPTYAPGTHTLTATYSGDTNYAATTLTNTHAVSLQPSITYLTALVTPINYGQIIGDIAVAHADPANPTFAGSTVGGSINVYIDGALVCVLPVQGSSACPPPTGMGYNVGTHIIYLQYTGNQFFAPSTSINYPVVIIPDDTQGTLASSSNPSTFGQPVTLSATFLSLPYPTSLGPSILPATGTVTFFDAATPIGTATLNASGVASITTSTLAIGTHPITATYAATVSFNASATTALPQVVKAAPLRGTSTVLTSSLNPSLLGQSVTFTANINSGPSGGPAPTGKVDFFDGVVTLGATPVNGGTAALTLSTLTVGSHNITAVYSGDSVTAGSTSNLVVQQVNLPGTPGFTLTVTPSDIAVPIGSSVSVAVTVTALNGFNQPVALTCSGLVAESSCTFGALTIPPGGGTTRVSIAAAAPHDCGSNTPYFISSGPTTLLEALATVSLLLLLRRRRRFTQLLALALAFGLLPTLTGCGHCTDLGVRPGNYTLTVTGTSTGSPAITASQTVHFTARL